MNDGFRQEVTMINKVFDKLKDTTNDEVAYNLYKKCSSTFDKYQDSSDVDTFRELEDATDNIIDFRSYIREYYPSKVYDNSMGAKENNKVKELSNGHPIGLEKENVA